MTVCQVFERLFYIVNLALQQTYPRTVGAARLLTGKRPHGRWVSRFFHVYFIFVFLFCFSCATGTGGEAESVLTAFDHSDIRGLVTYRSMVRRKALSVYRRESSGFLRSLIVHSKMAESCTFNSSASTYGPCIAFYP